MLACGVERRSQTATIVRAADPAQPPRGFPLRLRSLLAMAAVCGVLLLPTSFHLWPSQLACAQSPEFKSVRRVPAPSLEGGGEWINSDGPIRLQQLRGKIVILDFWTYCCINCLQTLPELKRLEQAFPREVVVIGVHSPKFFGERDTENIRAAVVRHQVDHPVVNDANLVIARKYGATGWPSLRVIDPQGYLIAAHFGEATFEMMSRFVRRVLPRYRRQRVLDETPLRFELERYSRKPTPLHFPGKVLVDAEQSRLFIADSGHNRIVIAALDGALLDTIGSGEYGRKNGPYDQASFASPQGMALRGDSLYVADTENHLIREVNLSSKQVKTVAGTGQQGRKMVVRAAGRPTGVRLASPWDLWIHEDAMYIAMAGSHQLWKMSFGRRARLQPYAGNTTEDIVDGPLLPRTPFQKGYASFAQPSGFASDGEHLFVADSEGSSIRAVPFRAKGNVATVLGTSRLPKARLFTFGDRDGPVNQALLQHPLAVAYWRDRLYVADTYNNKIKEIDLKQRVIKTIAGDARPGQTDEPARFDEPAGLSVADESIYVADTNNHAIRVIDLSQGYAVSTLQIRDLQPPKPPETNALPQVPGAKRITLGSVEAKPTDGKLRLRVQLLLPLGHSLNPQAPMSYVVEVDGDESVIDASATGRLVHVDAPTGQFEIELPLSQMSGTSQLKVSLLYYYCHEQAQALCKMGGVEWTGQIRLTDTASTDPVLLKHAVR